MSRAPELSTFQYAMRWPCGDQFGWTALSSVTSRVAPVASSTAHTALYDIRLVGASTTSVANATDAESGDHVGLKPTSVTRRTDSPVAPITKLPPPSRVDRNAIRFPSGDSAGWLSSTSGVAVRSSRFLPPTRCE